MKGVFDYFSISTVYKDLTDIHYPKNAIILHSTGIEDRSNIAVKIKEKFSEVIIAEIAETETQEITLEINSNTERLSLRSLKDSEKLSKLVEGLTVYLDITGLTHGAWAWILRALLLRDIGNTNVLYSEPIEYKFHDNPVDGQIFDLSAKFEGIAPLPGFLNLTTYDSGNFVFMPLLGFEGTRLSHIMEDVQAIPDYTFPVFGVAGFRYDFPFYTYQGNKNVLEREGIWRNWRYEQANCPVSIYILGTYLLKENPGKMLRIAPIGTKPHALGAVLLKLINPKFVDLIYDHPIRQTKRTKGRSNTICYQLDAFGALIPR